MVAPNPTIAAKATSAPGMSRRNRRDQKPDMLIVPVAARSRINSDVIRNPERVKNVETQKNPPLAQVPAPFAPSNPEWLAITKNNPSPRMPSRAGW